MNKAVGIKDKNGVDIEEGHIVTAYVKGVPKFTGKVIYVPHKGAFFIESSRNYLHHFLEIYEYEVAGQYDSLINL